MLLLLCAWSRTLYNTELPWFFDSFYVFDVCLLPTIYHPEKTPNPLQILSIFTELSRLYYTVSATFKGFQRKVESTYHSHNLKREESFSNTVYVQALFE